MTVHSPNPYARYRKTHVQRDTARQCRLRRKAAKARRKRTEKMHRQNRRR